MLQALRAALRARFVAWAMRARHDAEPAIVLSQRRIFVLPTRAGVLYAAALLVLLLAAINYNLALGHALVFLLAALGLVTVLHTFRNLAGLTLIAGQPAPVFAGETARFPLLLREPTGRARHRLRLCLPEQSAIVVDLPPLATQQALLPLAATRRGWLSMPMLTIACDWPLGLVRAWAYALPKARCLVYPQPARAVPPAPSFASGQPGRQGSSRGDEDFAGLRRHQPGDSLHHVAWKAAARLGPDAALLSKQFSGSAAQTLMFDWAALPASLDVESRLSILTRWALDAETSGVVWGLRLPGKEFAPARGAAHLQRCLTALALYEAA